MPNTQSVESLHDAATAVADGGEVGVKNWGGVIVQVTGSGTSFVLTPEGTLEEDGTEYVNIEGVDLNTGNKVTSIDATGLYFFPIYGLEKFRTRLSDAPDTNDVTVKARKLGADNIAGVSIADIDIQDATIGTVDQGASGSDPWQVEGAAADGDPASGNPVQVGGVDGAGNTQALSTNTDGEPVVAQPTHDDLNANANLQVGDTDVADANPVPVSDAGGSVTVDATDLDIRDLDAATDSATIQGTQGSLTDGSGTIDTGGTSQQVFAANANRVYLFIQNNSIETLWIQFGGAAVEDQPSIQLPASGDGFTMESNFVSTESVEIIGASAGSEFTAKEA